jgi:hypothetical protein
MPTAVVCSRIEEINASIQSVMNGAYRILIVHISPSSLISSEGPGSTNGPTAQTQGADFNFAAA